IAADAGRAVADPDADVEPIHARLDELSTRLTQGELPSRSWPLYGALITSLRHIAVIVDDVASTAGPARRRSRIHGSDIARPRTRKSRAPHPSRGRTRKPAPEPRIPYPGRQVPLPEPATCFVHNHTFVVPGFRRPRPHCSPIMETCVPERSPPLPL